MIAHSLVHLGDALGIDVLAAARHRSDAESRPDCDDLAIQASWVSLQWIEPGLERQEMQVDVLEAINRLSELIKAAQAGEEVVIANRGAPVVRMTPIDPPSSRGKAQDFVQWLRQNPLPRGAQRSHDAIEADIDDERSSWD